jgi:hypothetical protein
MYIPELIRICFNNRGGLIPQKMAKLMIMIMNNKNNNNNKDHSKWQNNSKGKEIMITIHSNINSDIKAYLQFINRYKKFIFILLNSIKIYV